MGQTEKKTQGDAARLGVLSTPNVILKAVRIPLDSGLVMGILPGVLLIGAEQPLWQTNRPYLKLFGDLGTKPEEVTAILGKGGYPDE